MPWDERSDEQLLAATVAGPSALPEFYRRHVAARARLRALLAAERPVPPGVGPYLKQDRTTITVVRS